MKWLARITDKTIPLSNYAGEAAGWRTCAVGEARGSGMTFDLRPGIGGDPVEPRDPKLHALGMDFDTAVRKNQRTAAFRLYLAIQTRAAKLMGVRA